MKPDIPISSPPPLFATLGRIDMATAEKRAFRKAPPLLKGTLVMWNDLKGFGFVRPEAGGDDHFVHISAFKRGLNRRPAIGDVIHFRPAELPGKKRVSFALIEGMEYEPPAPLPRPTKTVFAPKPRSWALTLLILLPLVFSSYLLWRAHNPIPFFSYTIFSILTMMLYGTDKTHAVTGRWRVPESYFHVFELLGGWPGALIGQNDFRHKTRKSHYQVIFRLIIGLHFLAWGAYFFFLYRTGAL
jgi:uncharacterized membrane protein YsdA (DUF1294 family)/cold shock CspA family protein